MPTKFSHPEAKKCIFAQSNRVEHNPYAILGKIRTFIFDVDGVLTDGRLLITEEGEELRSVHTRDGMAITIAIQQGYRVFVITGGTSQGMQKRMQKLKVSGIYTRCKNKLELAKSLCQEHSFDLSETLVMGDDFADLNLMKHAGLAVCPADAIPEIKEVSHFISPFKGGEGCVREMIEKVLRVQDRWIYEDQPNV